MGAWNDLVSKMFKEGREKNKDFKLKDAMKAASSVYHKESSPNTDNSSTSKVFSKKNKRRSMKNDDKCGVMIKKTISVCKGKSRKSRKSRKNRKSRKM